MAGIVPNTELLIPMHHLALHLRTCSMTQLANVIMALMIISCCGALLCWQFTLSRVFKNAAEAGYFPKVFARVNSKDAPDAWRIYLISD